MARSIIMGFWFVHVIVIMGCSGGDNSANNMVACELADVNQCFAWVNLSDALVDSLSTTCVNDDNGVIIESCPIDNLVGTCEQLDDPVTPDLLNHFYLPNGSDPVAYANAKEQACIDAGGNWVPNN